MTNLWMKLKGDRTALPATFPGKVVLLAWVGAFIAIASVALLSSQFSYLLILGSFGASCVVLFAYPDVPFSQPRNVILGHFLSSLTGLVFISFFGVAWWVLAAAVASAIAVMMLTRTVHPPAGSNPVIIWIMAASHVDLSWQFLLFPTLAGAVVITLVSLIYNNLTREGNYPKYWF